jgi:hypothetical protein
MRKNYSSSKPASLKRLNVFAVLVMLVLAIPMISQAAYNHVLSTPTNPAIPAANLCPSQLKAQVYAFTITTSGSGGLNNLTNISFTTNAGYAAADVSNFKLWINTTNNLATATQYGGNIVAGLGPGAHTFTAFTYTLTVLTHYLWITTDVAAAPTQGNVITVAAMGTADFFVSGGTKLGGGNIGGAQTLNRAPAITTQPTSPVTGCLGFPVTLNGLVATGGGLTYQWQYGAGGNVTNGNPAGSIYTNPTTSALTVDGLAVGSYTYKCIVSGVCSPSVTSVTVTLNVVNNNTVGVTIQGSTPQSGFGPFILCGPTSYTMTATPTNGGTNPTYNWQVNTVTQQNSTSNSFTWTVNPGDIVECIMTMGTGVTCPVGSPANSNPINFNAVGTVGTTPAQTTPLSTRCKGSGTTSTPNFTITADPDIYYYEWQIQNAGSSTITSPTTVNNTTITWDANFAGVAQIRMRANNVCLNGPGGWGPWRNDTVLAHYQPVSSIDPDLSIRKGLNAGQWWDTICHRTNVTFSNYVNSNVQPYPYGAATYEWYWNNNLVQSSTSNQYLNNNLLDNDTVRLRVIPGWTTTTTLYSDGNRCPSSAPFWSNTYHMDVYPSDPPLITNVVASPNPGCIGQAITLTATVAAQGLGPSPVYEWYDVSTGLIGTGLTYTGTFSAGMHDIFFMVTSSDTCASPNQVIFPSPVFYPLQINLCYDTMNVSGTQTINRCGGVLYDSGGPSGNYSNNESGVLSICPALAGQYVSLNFTSFSTEATNDVLTIYNGTSITDPILAPSPLSGSLSCSAPFTSSHASGCLTLRFQSNGVTTNTGWAANMSCVSTPASSTPGNGCSSPVMIASLPYSATGQTNQCFGNNHGSGCAAGNTSGTDKFYRYDANGPECITVNLNGATSNAISLSVWKDCPTLPGTCIASWTTATGGNIGGQTTLPMVGTYYIVVDANVGVNFNYNIVINTFGAAPLNDLPCNAEQLIQTIPHYDDNSCAGTESGGGVNNSNCVNGNLNTLWYTFTTNAGQTAARVRFTRGLGTLTDPIIQVYGGTCSALSYINCNDDGVYCSVTYDIPYLQWTTTPSTQYWIRVDGYLNTVGSYQLVVDDPNSVVSAYGYDCGNPIMISAQSCTYGNPAFIGIGNKCDFPYSNNAGFFGERDGVYYLFETVYGQNGATTLTFDIYSDPSVTTDWDFIIWNVTPYYPSQICEYLNYGFGPWNTSVGNISSSWVDTWQNPANGHTGCRSTGTTHINGFPFNAPIPLSSTQGSPAGHQWWVLYISNFRFGQYPYGFTLDVGHSTTSTVSNFNPTSPGAVVYNTTQPPQMIWWTGQGGTSNWFTQANWGGCAVPSCANGTSATVATYYSPSNPYFPVINGAGAISKDFTIRPGGSLTINSGFNLDMCGNWLNLGTFTANSNSAVTCTGNNTQFFDGLMSGSNSFENLNMSKTPGIHMYLYNRAQVTGTLGLTNGRIITGAKELFVSNLSPASVPTGNAQSFVQGNLRRNLDPTGGIYYWPVGTTSWQLAKLTFGTGVTIPNILGFFSPWGSLPGPLGLVDGPCNASYTSAPGFLNNGYWTLTASANPTGAQYDMVLYNTSVTNGGGSTAWTVAKAPTIAGGWVLDGNCDNTSTQAITKRNGMSGFSVFATAQSNVPVPITLLNFDAVAKGTNVLATWVTATEINNDYFVVERSTDGINFEQVGTRKGAGNSSNTLYYSMTDLEPFAGVSYYRLRQVDFDGQQSESQLVAVNFLDNNVLTVYPNPANNSDSYLSYEFNAFGDGMVHLEVIDMLGKVVMAENVNALKGNNVFKGHDGLNISFLPHGVYILQVKPVNNEIIEPMQKRFIKQTREE